VFAAVGGLMRFISMFIAIWYSSYNYYRMKRHILIHSVMAKPSLFPDQYNFKKHYCRLFWGSFCCLNWGKGKDNISNYPQKYENLRAANVVFSERMDLQNYLHDSMDLYAIRQLMMKSRHQI